MQRFTLQFLITVMIVGSILLSCDDGGDGNQTDTASSGDTSDEQSGGDIANDTPAADVVSEVGTGDDQGEETMPDPYLITQAHVCVGDVCTGTDTYFPCSATECITEYLACLPSTLNEQEETISYDPAGPCYDYVVCMDGCGCDKLTVSFDMYTGETESSCSETCTVDCALGCAAAASQPCTECFSAVTACETAAGCYDALSCPDLGL